MRLYGLILLLASTRTILLQPEPGREAQQVHHHAEDQDEERAPVVGQPGLQLFGRRFLGPGHRRRTAGAQLQPRQQRNPDFRFGEPGETVQTGGQG